MHKCIFATYLWKCAWKQVKGWEFIAAVKQSSKEYPEVGFGADFRPSV